MIGRRKLQTVLGFYEQNWIQVKNIDLSELSVSSLLSSYAIMQIIRKLE